MKITDVFRSIAAVLTKPLSDTKFKTISSENVMAQLEDAKWAVTSVAESFDDLGDKAFDVAYSKTQSKLKLDQDTLKMAGRPAAEAFLSFDKNLKGKSRALGLFKSIQLAARSLVATLDSLQKDMDTMIGDKEGLVVGDLQISHGLLFGTIEAAQLFSTMNSYILVSMSSLVTYTKNSDQLPRYILDYIVKYNDVYLDIINQTCNAQSGATVSNNIRNLKKRGVDFKLSAAPMMQRGLTADTLAVENVFLSVFGIFISIIGFFGELYTDVRHLRYERVKERKKWLECHIANLRLDAEGTNPDDPNYVKNQNIIKYYNDELAKLDKKLQDYYNG